MLRKAALGHGLTLMALGAAVLGLAAMACSSSGEDTSGAVDSPLPAPTVAASWQVVPVQPYSRHVSPEQEHPPYNSRPATSGWHYGVTAPWGIYAQVIPDEVLVHNLEHGGIGVHYDCPFGCPELVARLADVVAAARQEGRKVVMSPFNDMDRAVALTAWTYIDRFDEFDEARILAFIRAHESSPNSPEPSVR